MGRRLKTGLHDTICLTDSFVFMLGHCVNFKAIRYESTSVNRIVSNKSHRLTLALKSSPLFKSKIEIYARWAKVDQAEGHLLPKRNIVIFVGLTLKVPLPRAFY